VNVPNSMTWTACNITYIHIMAAGSNRYAIVTCIKALTHQNRVNFSRIMGGVHELRIESLLWTCIPEDMNELYFFTMFVFSKWIPSVLGLFAGAFMPILSTWTFLHIFITIWNVGLFLILTPRILKLKHKSTLIACICSNSIKKFIYKSFPLLKD
jgi:hypothetical protein